MVGLTLETYSAIVASVLTALALGSWIGGGLADSGKPQRTLLAVMLIAGGTLVATPFGLQALRGLRIQSSGLLLLSSLLFMPAPLALASMFPVLVRLRLKELDSAGRTVGSYTAIATAGAVAGTLITGFFLLGQFSVTRIVYWMGIVWLVAPLLLGFGVRLTALVALGVVTPFLAIFAVPNPSCDFDTKYHCAKLVPVSERGQYNLYLDGLLQGYIDTKNPWNVHYDLFRQVGSLVELAESRSSSSLNLFIGGGAMTMPRFAESVYPNSRNVVIEIDPGVVRLVASTLARDDVFQQLDVRIGDARTELRKLEPKSLSFVFGDAFTSLSPPWHLTTLEHIEAIESLLAWNGIYVMNVIDAPPFLFVRSEVKTMSSVFDFVALSGSNEAWVNGGNFLIIASHTNENAAAFKRLNSRFQTGRALKDWSTQGHLLLDEYAPVENLITYRR